MGQLHDRMEQDLVLESFSPDTIRNYLLYCRKFAAFLCGHQRNRGRQHPPVLSCTRWSSKNWSYNSYRQMYSALKFLYTVTLKRPGEVGRLPFPQGANPPLPNVFTPQN